MNKGDVFGEVGKIIFPRNCELMVSLLGHFGICGFFLSGANSGVNIKTIKK